MNINKTNFCDDEKCDRILLQDSYSCGICNDTFLSSSDSCILEKQKICPPIWYFTNDSNSNNNWTTINIFNNDQRIHCVQESDSSNCSKSLKAYLKPFFEIPQPEKLEEFNMERLLPKAALAVLIFNFILITIICGIVFWWCRNKKTLSSQKSRSPSSEPIKMDNLYKDYIIPSESLIYLEKLGTGNSADVHLADYTDNSAKIKVAVKALKFACSKTDTLKEIKLLSLCKHSNIVSFIGWMETFDEQMCIVTEYMAGGDLSTYLTTPDKLLLVSTVFSYIEQILDAMIYLSHKHILHRDLAARNCLLNETYEILKINDFGLSREMDINYEYISEANPRLPFRWLPLEALLPTSSQYKTFTFKGDIWAFGILVWEMFERGHELYDGISLPSLIRFLRAGHRLPRPQHCPLELYKKMLLCWDENPDNRPNFDDLQTNVKNVYQQIKIHDPNKLNIAIELKYGNEYERPNVS